MYISDKMKKISSYPVPENLISLLEKNQTWGSERNQYSGLEETGSIPLKYNFNYPDGMLGICDHTHDSLYNMVKDVVELVGKNFAPYYCSRAVIAKLPKGAKVKEHVDPGLAFDLFHRFCWVIKTNPEAKMVIDGDEQHFSLGEIWEINNKLPHSAYNEGESDRIHLIFDLASVESLIGKTPLPFKKDSYDEKLFNIILKKRQKAERDEV